MAYYFFKVTLRYFDDESTTFYITPDQSDTDDEGIPFSETDLTNTQEFKDFVKINKADIVDVEYTEYKVTADGKNDNLSDKEMSQELFEEIERKGGLLEIIDENDFPIIVKKIKSSGGNKNKMLYIGIIAAAVVVLGLLAASAFVKKDGDTSSNSSDVSSTTTQASTQTASSAESSPASTTESASSDITEVTESTVPVISTAVSETPPAPSEVPSVPAEVPTVQNLIATAGADYVTLLWDAVPSADSYRVDTAHGGIYEVLGKTQDTTFNAVGLEPNTTYEFDVTAIIGEERGKEATVTITTLPAVTSTSTAVTESNEVAEHVSL